MSWCLVVQLPTESSFLMFIEYYNGLRVPLLSATPSENRIQGNCHCLGEFKTGKTCVCCPLWYRPTPFSNRYPSQRCLSTKTNEEENKKETAGRQQKMRKEQL
jgi:hypothetical protein